MKKIWLIVTGLALVLAVAGLAGCGAGDATWSGGSLKVNLNSQQEGIWVSGTGKVSVMPDIAILRLGIEAQEASVAVAQSQATAAMDKVMKALADNGVAKNDIQTQYFSIRRITRWDNVKEQEVVIGYRVTNMVTAKIREMDRVGAVVDAVALAGGDLTRVDSIGFSIDDPSENRQEARQKAVAEAEAKAKQLAESAGVKLGRPIYISESTVFPSPVYRQDLFEKAAGAPMVETPITPGELEVSVSVQVAYAISE